MKQSISVIIPVLDEEKSIGELLAYLKMYSSDSLIQEIIVVDGGSEDQTRELVKTFGETILIEAPKGRAKQMNAGAKIAIGEILYFLHADTFPPSDFGKQIIQSLEEHHAGCFRLKFGDADHWLLKIGPWFTRFHHCWFRGGDQSLFIRKKDFDQLEGFDERFLIYEDVELIGRIYKVGKFSIIDDFVVTSARKFRSNGTLRLFFQFFHDSLEILVGCRS